MAGDEHFDQALLLSGGRCGQVDGVPVDRYDPVAFHGHLGIVPQEAYLFSGTGYASQMFCLDCARKITVWPVKSVWGQRTAAK